MARNGLQRHVTADKVKWALTFIAFVLVGVMLAGIICGWFDKDDKAEEFGEVETNILVFDDIGAKRTAYGPDKQVWEENGITFTNLKGTGQDVGNYSAPIRLYAHSIIKVESTGMTKIVFYCSGASYARALENSFEEGTDAAVSGSDVTVTFRRATDTFNIIDLTAQVQLDKIAVTTLVTEDTEESMVLTEEVAGHGVSLMSAVIPREEYDDYGIMPIADTAYTLTATVNFSNGLVDESGLSRGVTWEIAWKSEKSDPVSNYVQMETTENTATLTCLKSFSTQIIVTARAKSDPEKTATCTLNYARTLTGYDVKLFDSEQTIDFVYNYPIHITLPAAGCHVEDSIRRAKKFFWYNGFHYDAGSGTVDNPVSVNNITITPSEDLKTAYKSVSPDGDMVSSISASPQASATMEKIDTLIHLYMTLTQQTNEGAFLGMGFDTALSRAFQAINGKAAFKVDLVCNLSYGSTSERTKTFTYSVFVNLDDTLATVSGVTLNGSSHVFY